MSNSDLDAPRCEGCHAPLEVVKHDSEGAHYYNGPGLQVRPDGLWSYACECDWEHNDGTGPFPSWRRFAPELCEQIARLTRERDEARAELAATNYSPDRLEPLAPPGWRLSDDDPTDHVLWRWVREDGHDVAFLVAGGWFYRSPDGELLSCHGGPLSLMRAADKALTEAGQ